MEGVGKKGMTFPPTLTKKTKRRGFPSKKLAIGSMIEVSVSGPSAPTLDLLT